MNSATTQIWCRVKTEFEKVALKRSDRYGIRGFLPPIGCSTVPWRLYYQDKNHRMDKEKQARNWNEEHASLEQLKCSLAEFAAERKWDTFHTPRNLLLAMVGEVGELSEIFQWKADEQCSPGLAGFSPEEKIHLGEELADVLLYLIRLSDRCGVDLGAAAVDKMRKNAIKYPAKECQGRSDKYTAYRT